MRHAFLVIAHNEPQVLTALLRQLDATGFDVYLHIDAKAVEMQEQFATYKPHYGGFHFLMYGGETLHKWRLKCFYLKPQRNKDPTPTIICFRE